MTRLLLTPDDLRAFVRHDPLCQELAAVARAHDRPMALVGGCVRDWLLGRQPLDWDVVVPGDPTPLARTLLENRKGALVTLDAEFGVVRTPLKGGVVVDFARQQGETLEADLFRRDLALNALAIRLDTGELIDPTEGLADLEHQRIRAFSKANLQSDPLRLLRVFRFAATLCWEVEPQTLAWVEDLAPLIAQPAGERVLAELAKLLDGPCGPAALTQAYYAGLLAPLFPELAQGPTGLAKGLRLYKALAADLAEVAETPECPPYDARTLELLGRPLAGNRPGRVALYLAALLLPLAGNAAALGEIAERLQIRNKERAWLEKGIAGAAEALPLPELEGRDARLETYKLIRDHGEVSLAAAWLAFEAAEAPSRAIAERWVGWHCDFQRFYWDWHDANAATPRLLTGADLQRDLGLRPGPRFGQLLEAVEEARALGDVQTREEALAWVATILERGE